jgi:LPXTG-site transpeptidase (sortase) family protein
MSGKIAMKRLVIICTSGLLIIVLFLWARSFSGHSSPPSPEVLVQVVPTFSPIPVILPAVPARVKIPSLDIDAHVETVDLDDKGNMDVPKEDENVGWYSLGFRPGEQGSSVLAGHLDTKAGGPAVFFHLDKLKSGEQVQVTDGQGQVFVYIVESSKEYPYDKLPLQDVFASTEPLLRLITCKGSFDSQAENYSDRLVVTARLQTLE